MWLIKIPVKDTPVMPRGLDPSGLGRLEICILHCKQWHVNFYQACFSIILPIASTLL